MQWTFRWTIPDTASVCQCQSPLLSPLYHIGEWLGGSVWKQLDLQESPLSLFDQHSDGVAWQAEGEPGLFCAANNVLVLPNKVSARGSTCSPATVTQSPSARTHRCQNTLQPHLKRLGTWKCRGSYISQHFNNFHTFFQNSHTHFYTTSLVFRSLGFSNDS